MRHHLLESIVEQDDAILHKYLEEHELSEDEIRTVLRKATISGKVVPVLAGAAFKNKGVQALLDARGGLSTGARDVPAIQGHLPHTTPRTRCVRPPMRSRSPRSRSRS